MARTVGKVRIGLVGLGFGAEFIPIYQRHPEAEVVGICQRDPRVLGLCGDRFAIPLNQRHTDYATLLADPTIDAIHINTPSPAHAIAALAAGKHVACTVPMATSVEACAAIVRAQRAAGRNYMMMSQAWPRALLRHPILAGGHPGRCANVHTEFPCRS